MSASTLLDKTPVPRTISSLYAGSGGSSGLPFSTFVDPLSGSGTSITASGPGDSQTWGTTIPVVAETTYLLSVTGELSCGLTSEAGYCYVDAIVSNSGATEVANVRIASLPFLDGAGLGDANRSAGSQCFIFTPSGGQNQVQLKLVNTPNVAGGSIATYAIDGVQLVTLS